MWSIALSKILIAVRNIAFLKEYQTCIFVSTSMRVLELLQIKSLQFRTATNT